MGSDLNCPLLINPPTVHDRHEREDHWEGELRRFYVESGHSTLQFRGVKRT
jgi:hypothetical protein